MNNVNLEIHDREYLAVLGPSGCGKTTLIKCLAGIHKPTEGEIYFDDKLVNDLQIEERGIGYVFQEIALFPHMNVRDNITYSPRVKGLPEETASKTAKELLKMTRLNVESKSSPAELSGGAKQKVGLARALASGSDVLFLDEPLSSLDAKVRTELRYEVRNITRDLGLTTIHITHDQEEAMSIADRVVVMKAGRIVEAGSPHELYSKPSSIFGANFVGETNFLEGQVSSAGVNGSLVESNGLVLESTDKSREVGEKVVVAIRPEHVSMEKDLYASGAMIGQVEHVDFEGSSVRYELVLEDFRSLIARVYGPSERIKFGTGDTVELRIPPEHVLLYTYPEKGLEKELALE